MIFFGEVTLSHPGLPLDPTLDAADGVEVELVYRTAGVGESSDRPECRTRFMFVRVSRDYDGFETATAADPTVTDRSVVAELDGERVYRVRVDGELELVPSKCAEQGTHLLGAWSTDGQWTIRVQFFVHQALATFGEYVRDYGVEYDINRLVRADHVADGWSFSMTADQRDALLTAYETGYFDVPRRASQQDLADELDVSPSAVSQRLRRATASLVANALATPDGD